MIAVDTQILAYAHRRESPFHGAALARLVELAESGRPWAIPWPCVHEFLGIVTRPKLYDSPSSIQVALSAIQAWKGSAGLRFLGEGADHWERLSQLAVQGLIVGPRIHDARVAAICLSHGVKVLWTADRDFSRFPQLSTHNPCVAG
jgi:toxin-antitoxin system PIN domain toxin